MTEDPERNKPLTSGTEFNLFLIDNGWPLTGPESRHFIGLLNIRKLMTNIKKKTFIEVIIRGRYMLHQPFLIAGFLYP